MIGLGLAAHLELRHVFQPADLVLALVIGEDEEDVGLVGGQREAPEQDRPYRELHVGDVGLPVVLVRDALDQASIYTAPGQNHARRMRQVVSSPHTIAKRRMDDQYAVYAMLRAQS